MLYRPNYGRSVTQDSQELYPRQLYTTQSSQEMPVQKKRRYSSSSSSAVARRRRQQLVLRNPMRFRYRTVASAADRAHVVIPMAQSIQIGWNPRAGLLSQAQGPSIVWGVTQQGPIYQIGNNPTWSTGTLWNNYASAAALFQMYRIREFEIEVIYSQTSFTQSQNVPEPIPVNAPICYSVLDREDARIVANAQEALQYASCKYDQFGNNRRIVRKMLAPSTMGEQLDDTSLIGATTPAQVSYGPWLACGSNTSGATAPVIPHGFIKMFFDNMSQPSDAEVGVFCFVVKAIFEYKGFD